MFEARGINHKKIRDKWSGKERERERETERETERQRERQRQRDRTDVKEINNSIRLSFISVVFVFKSGVDTWSMPGECTFCASNFNASVTLGSNVAFLFAFLQCKWT